MTPEEIQGLKLGNIIYKIQDTKKYEVVKIRPFKKDFNEVFVAHMDGDCSKIKSIYTHDHCKDWVKTYDEAWVEKSHRHTREAKKTADFVKNDLKLKVN